MCLISEVRIHGSPQSTLLTPLSQSLSHSLISAQEPGKPAVHIPVRAWLGIRSCRKVTAWCDTDGEGETTLVKRLEQLEGYTTAFRDEAAPAAPSVWAGTSHGAANAPPQWIHQFVLTNPLLFALQPPQGLFPSPGAVGSGLGASAAAAAAQTARVCSGCSQRHGTSVPGLRAARPGMDLAPGTGPGCSGSSASPEEQEAQIRGSRCGFQGRSLTPLPGQWDTPKEVLATQFCPAVVPGAG